MEIKVTKEDAETGKKLEGAVFGIYNKNDILAGGKVLVKADTLLQKITSDKNGLAQFTCGSASWQVLCEGTDCPGWLCIFRGGSGI
ncbi:MAG: prealbumin-like fold domain-containing protein [Blautia faecis]